MKLDQIAKLVGNTPLVNIGTYKHATLWAKLEGYNPTGSLKDRTAFAMVNQYLDSGQSGHTLLDASSGSFACSLSYFCRLAGLPVTLVVNSKISEDNVAFLNVQGAEIIRHGSVTGESRTHCLKLMAEKVGFWHMTDQLTNPLSPCVHAETTGMEILTDCPEVTAIFGSKGSGATLCGVSRLFAKVKPRVKIYGSIGRPGDIGKVAGTYVEGVDFVTDFIEELSVAQNYAGDIPIDFREAMSQCQSLPVLVGPQGGGVYCAAKTAIEKDDLRGDVVLIMGDTMLKNVSRFK